MSEVWEAVFERREQPSSPRNSAWYISTSIFGWIYTYDYLRVWGVLFLKVNWLANSYNFFPYSKEKYEHALIRSSQTSHGDSHYLPLTRRKPGPLRFRHPHQRRQLYHQLHLSCIQIQDSHSTSPKETSSGESIKGHEWRNARFQLRPHLLALNHPSKPTGSVYVGSTLRHVRSQALLPQSSWWSSFHVLEQSWQE